MPLLKINDDWKYILLIIALSFIFFWKVLISPNKMIFAEYFSDVVSQFVPYRAFVYETWNSYGQLPLWNPYILMGHPFLGNPLSAMFYPQNILYLIFSGETLFGYLFLVDVVVAGVFTYFFMRVLQTNKFASLISACVFMFSGVIVARVYGGNVPNVEIISLFPLALLLLEISIRKKSLFYGVLTGISLGLQILAGHPEYVLYSFFSLSVYFLLRLLFVCKDQKSLKPVIRLVPIFLSSLIIAISLSAVQLIPSFELSIHSSRIKGDYQFATSYSFPPEQLVTFLMPEFYGTFLDNTYWGGRNFWELCVYVGVFPLILAIVAIILRRNKYTITFTLLGLFSLLFAFGRYSPIFSIFFNLVPLFKILRTPPVMLFVSIFSISVLSGFGSSVLFQKMGLKDKKTISKFIKVLIGLAVLILVATVSVLVGRDYFISLGKDVLLTKYESFTTEVHPLRYGLEYYMEKIPQAYSHIFINMVNFLVVITSIIFVLSLRLRKKIDTKHFKIFVLLIIILDSWFFGMKYIDVIEPNQIFVGRVPTEVLEFFEQDKDSFRVLDFAGILPQSVSMGYHINTITGYDAIQLSNYREFTDFFFDINPDLTKKPFLSIVEDMSVNNSKILGLMNVKYIITENEIDNEDFFLRLNSRAPVYDLYLKTSDEKEIFIYENKDFLPRAFIVSNAKTIKNDSHILEEMKSEDFEPKKYVILEEYIEPISGELGESEALIVEYTHNEIEITTSVSTPGFLVLSENYYLGWTATDNGKETEIYRTDYILRSVYLDEGQHTVKFVYNPDSFRLGSSITIVTALLVCALVLYKIKSNLQRK